MNNTITKATVNQRRVWRVYYQKNNGVSKDFSTEDEAKFYANLPYFETEKYNERKALKQGLRKVLIKAPKFYVMTWKFDHSEYWFYELTYNYSETLLNISPIQKWNFRRVHGPFSLTVSKTFLSKHCRLVTIFPGTL